MKAKTIILISNIAFLSLLIISGCAPTAMVLHDGSYLKNISVITSDHDDYTDTILYEIFGNNKTIRTISVIHVNGKNSKGTTDFITKRNDRFNNLFGKFKFEVLSGKQEIFVTPGVKTQQDVYKNVSFIAEPGHNYYLGEVIERENIWISDKYSWIPVLVDMTSRKLIFPENKN